MSRPLRSRATSNRNSRRLNTRGSAASSNGRLRSLPAPPNASDPRALPVAVARQAQREMDRLRRLPSGSPEAAQVRAYLHWLWTLPWDVVAPEDADRAKAEIKRSREDETVAE